MKALARRGFLRIIGAAPGAAAAIGLNQTLATHGVSTLMPHTPPMPGGESRTFTNFADWLRIAGERSIRREARNVYAFDGDLLEMHLPLATKIRLQRARNYERVKAEKAEEFEYRVSLKGVFEWWG